MPNIVALVPVDLHRCRLDLPSRVGRRLGDRAVLGHTIARLDSVNNIDAIVLVHPPGQNVLALLDGQRYDKKILTSVDPHGLRDAASPRRIAARKWCLTGWRGGLGGATCYDELLPAAALHAAMIEHHAESALVVGGDWCLVDPHYCQRVAALHLENPQALAMTFCQAPPGMAGIVAGRELMRQFAENHAGFGRLLAYNPARPQADPIGRDVCVQVDPMVRSCQRRFIYDTPRSAAMIDAIAAELGDDLPRVDAAAVARVARHVDQSDWLPQQVTLELTPDRPARGPLTPQSHLPLQRGPIHTDVARRIVRELGAVGDVALTLGGLGDALLHEHWPDIVTAAHEAGVFGICVETDLLVDRPQLDHLLQLPIDVISVRLNADCAETYQKMMGNGQANFARVMENMQYLLQHRPRRENPAGESFRGWIVPRLIKTADTLKDMETFFERWMTLAGHAVIEPATTGCGLMPDFAPLDMSPPRRVACRQLPRRMSVHADARVARCDQDWLGGAQAGNAAEQPLSQIWQSMAALRQAHAAGRWNELELCSQCRQWHRP